MVLSLRRKTWRSEVWHELLGTKQTGIANMKIADLVRDAWLIPQVQKLANYLWQQHPTNANAIIERWLAYREKYGNA